MEYEVEFYSYTPDYKKHCLAIFDENCPEYFAPNERVDYEAFLESAPIGYEVCLINERVVGAYGFSAETDDRIRLNWILLAAKYQGEGLGSIIMDRIIQTAKDEKLTHIDIATSHLSKHFFKKHGAVVVSEKENGWGVGMHRVDMVLALERSK